MKNRFLGLSLCFLCIVSYACAAPFKYGYFQDFSAAVSVPDTSSKKVTKAQTMDKKMTALELSQKMGNGINLGNTMEAYRGWNKSTKQNVSTYERMWGQPLTTPAIMNAYKDAGFDCVRIPVAWTNMMDYEHGDYKIGTALLDRVEEIVNYALDAGLYVIINDHWDGQWWGMFGSANQEHRDKAVILYKSLWTQVAVRFRNYSEMVIFEGANEELGSRLNDDTALSGGKKGNLGELECYQATNLINQCFVDLVRSTGGNNADRFLLIAGYDTDIDRTCDTRFEMPKDSAQNRLLISVHYYTPSTYCILSEDANWGKVKNSWGTAQDKKLLDDNFAKMKKFVDAGYGVIIGEYGVSKTKSGAKKEGMEAWMTAILDNCDKYNYVPMLWDCNTFFHKDGKLGFTDPEIAAVYKDRK